MRLVRLAALGVAGLAPLFAAPSAAADPTAEGAAVAQGLFDAARALMADGHYDEACPKLEESLRLDPGVGTQYHLGDCYEHVGKTASAWAAFLQVAALAKAAGQADREKVARTRAHALEPRVPHVVISVAPGERSADFTVKRDGETVGIAQLDTPLPLDPGPHVVSAEASGQTFAKRFELDEGGSAHVEVPPLGASPRPAPIAAPREETEPAAPRGRTQRILGVVTASVGVVGLGLGTFFGLRSMSKRNDADMQCNSQNFCTASGVAARDDAMTAGNVATVSFIAGGVLLAGGVALYLTAPSGEKRVARTTPAGVTLRVRGLSLAAEGSF